MSNSKSKTYELEAQYGGSYTVQPRLNMYAHYNNLYVGLDYLDPEDNLWAPYASVTVNLMELPYLYAAIDTNNNGPKIVDFLEQNGFGQRTDLVIPSGMCVFPVFLFKEDKLREIDANVFAEYAKHHSKQKQPLDHQIDSAEGKTSAGATKAEAQPER